MATNFLNFQRHAVAGSSKLKATTAGHIYNIKIEQDLDNGSVVAKGTHNFTIKAQQAYCDREKKLFSIIVPDEE